MQRKFTTSVKLSFLFMLIVLIGCNENHQDGGKNESLIKYDTSIAAKSVIPIAEAARFQQSFITTFGELKKLIKDTGYLSKNFNIPNGEAFSKDAILLLLSQKEAEGIRVYYGKDAKGVVRLVLLPVRKDGSVIYNKLINVSKSSSDSSLNRAQGSAEAVETGQTCPPCLIDAQFD